MLLEKSSPKTTIYSTLITTFGLKQNEYRDAFISVITLDDLFALLGITLHIVAFHHMNALCP